MPQWTGKRLVLVITACLNHQGKPQFVRTEVEITQDECQNGLHIALVEHRLKDSGYVQPFDHFDQFDSSRLLLVAIKESAAQATRLPDSMRNSAREEP